MKIAFCHYDLPDTFIQDFLKKWPMYEFIDIKNKLDEPEDIPDYSEFFLNSQKFLTGRCCDEIQSGYLKGDVVYNNTMLNILTDTLIAADSGLVKDTEFITNQFVITQNMFKFLDVIFWLNDESETKDNLELATRLLFKQYNKDSWDQSGLIFPLKDRPAFIEINYDPENPKASIRAMEEYLDKNGKIYEPDNEYLASQFADMKNSIDPEEMKKFFLRE